MKVQIKHRYTVAVLFECEVPDSVPSGLAMRHALEQAVALNTNLDGANLDGANLVGAHIFGANFRGANFRGANLFGANLVGSNLVGANFFGANLDGANLDGANLDGADGKHLPRATPAQAVENLDRVRAIILDNKTRLEMDHWHQNADWKERTCAEETLCETTHCLAGWLQVCTTEPGLKTIDAQLAGILAAPVAAKMFFRKGDEVLAWLENREYAEAV